MTGAGTELNADRVAVPPLAAAGIVGAALRSTISNVKML